MCFILFFGVKHSLIHLGEVLDVCFFKFWATASSSINCFWKIRVALKRYSWCNLMQADLIIWTDSAGCTGWEVLTVIDVWKMALVMVLVEVERVKMVVVC